jgi:hypothetical protein
MTSPKPLRLWPGVVAAVVLCVLRYAVPLVFSDAFVVGFLGAVVCAVAILVWWVFFSRAPWFERIGALVVIVVAFLVTRPLLHKSIATGMMGMMYPIFALPPVVAPVLVAWAALTRNFSDGVRRATMVVAMFLACGVWLFFRTDGIIGSGSQITWRWTPSAEERLLAKGEETSPEPATKPSVAAAPTSPEDGAAAGRNAESATVLPSPLPRAARAEWPGFRGPNRGQRDRWCASQHRLDDVAAGAIVATASRTRLVVVCRHWRRPLHAGATRRVRRGRRVPRQYGPTDLAPPGSGPFLGIERWSGAARDTDNQPQSRLHIWRDRNPQCARCRYGRSCVVPQRRNRCGKDCADVGVRQLAIGDR